MPRSINKKIKKSGMNINENIKEENSVSKKGWSEITIGQYQEILTIQTDNEFTQFIEAISICEDIDPEDLRNIPLKELKQKITDYQFLKTEPDADFKTTFSIDGVEYGIEPELALMSGGVFIDCEQFRRNTNENLHNLCALVWRPITKWSGEEYEIEPHKAVGFEKRANLFKNKLSIEFVKGGLLFFSLLGIELSLKTLDCLVEQMKIVAATKNLETTTQTPMKKSK